MIIPNYTERLSSKHPFANERIAMNRLTCEIIKDYPIAGIGFGMMIYANPEFLDSYEARCLRNTNPDDTGPIFQSRHLTTSFLT